MNVAIPLPYPLVKMGIDAGVWHPWVSHTSKNTEVQVDCWILHWEATKLGLLDH